jgi:hypothetical protein
MDMRSQGKFALNSALTLFFLPPFHSVSADTQ